MSVPMKRSHNGNPKGSLETSATLSSSSNQPVLPPSLPSDAHPLDASLLASLEDYLHDLKNETRPNKRNFRLLPIFRIIVLSSEGKLGSKYAPNSSDHSPESQRAWQNLLKEHPDFPNTLMDCIQSGSFKKIFSLGAFINTGICALCI